MTNGTLKKAFFFKSPRSNWLESAWYNSLCYQSKHSASPDHYHSPSANELGLESISTRADFLSLTTFHKILVKRSRPLVRSCMPTPTPYSEHSTRHRKLFVPYKSNSVKFSNSFFPIMAKKYENLPISCCSKGDPDLFKEQLRSHLVPKRGSKLGAKLLTQMRVGRSLLNSHSYTVGKSLSHQCSCHFPQQSPSHYFLDCFLYTEERRSLFSTFEHFIPDFIYFRKKKKTWNYFVWSWQR